MNRLAVSVAHRAVTATMSMPLAQATASSLFEIETRARLDPDIAAPPLVAMNGTVRVECTARGDLIQAAPSAAAFNALAAHPVAARLIPGFMTTNGSLPMPTRAWHR